MRRCYRGAALALGGILAVGTASFSPAGPCVLTAHAAEIALLEDMEKAFQEEVRAEEENVETDIPSEKTEGEMVLALTTEPEAALETTTEPQVAEPERSGGVSFSLDEQEYQLLLKIVEAEAGGEDTTGKLLVANVVMNRVQSEAFPDSVTGVVYQTQNGRAQFSPTVDGRLNTVSVSAETVEAVSRAMSGENVSQGALFFRSANSKSGWFDRALNRVLEYGNHIFYTM